MQQAFKPLAYTSGRVLSRERYASHGGSSCSSHPYDEKLDNIMAFVQDISTNLFGLASIMHLHHTRFDTRFTSLQTQLDQIQRKLEQDKDYLFLDKKGEMVHDRGRKS